MTFSERLNDRDFHQAAAWTVIGLSPIVALLLLVVKPSTYGKLHNSKTSRFGPVVTAKWCWMIFESPNWIWVLYSMANLPWTADTDSSGKSHAWAPLPLPNAVLIAWFSFHYIHRSIWYPLNMSSESKFPIGIMFATVPYCCLNGYLQTVGLSRFQKFEGSNDYFTSPCFLFGAFLAVTGFALAYHSDQTLLNLRRKGSYQIPRGGGFDYVLCPHYLGDILEWCGFCLACQGSVASLSFVIWTTANLIPRAIAQNEWYRDKFEDYPMDRHAILPFVL